MIEFLVERDLARQVNSVRCDLVDEERLRRMSRAEFQRLLREQLQLFGDQIMQAWESLYAEPTADRVRREDWDDDARG